MDKQMAGDVGTEPYRSRPQSRIPATKVPEPNRPNKDAALFQRLEWIQSQLDKHLAVARKVGLTLCGRSDGDCGSNPPCSRSVESIVSDIESTANDLGAALADITIVIGQPE